MADALSASIFVGETVSQGTSGSVLFVDTNGHVAQNNAAFFWDNPNLRLGVNTKTPRRGLDVLDASNPQVRLTFTDNVFYTDLKTDSSGNFSAVNTGGTFAWSAATNPATGQIISTIAGGQAFFQLIGGVGGFGQLQSVVGDFFITNADPASTIIFRTNSIAAFKIDASQILFPAVALATNMTTGFINIPGAAGPPTGVPASTTGFPQYYDKTNKKLYIYDGAWKKGQVSLVDVIYA